MSEISPAISGKSPPADQALTSQPVRVTPLDAAQPKLRAGIGLCLSGGGYRAMLFHAGALWRLNEVGLLGQLARVSSVSGGSITAGVLGLHWNNLAFDASTKVSPTFPDLVVTPLRKLASTTIDRSAIIGGIALPGSVSDRIVAAYKKHLFGEATLQALPDSPPGPRFVINATNVQSGVLWRFSKPYMADYRVGQIKNPTIPLALAVAASSAFPPFLSPVLLECSETQYVAPDGTEDLHRSPFTTEVILTDGGVYDNLGLETVWKEYETVLVSDGGGSLEPEAEPKFDWPRHAFRVLNIINNQVVSVRKRQTIEAFVQGRPGAYWGIRTHIADYGLDSALPCPADKTLALANTPTRLKRLEDADQEKIINWGYAVCDAAIRTHVLTTAKAPAAFPYAVVGVG